jgi:hypothetical protein
MRETCRLEGAEKRNNEGLVRDRRMANARESVAKSSFSIGRQVIHVIVLSLSYAALLFNSTIHRSQFAIEHARFAPNTSNSGD